MTSLLPRIVSAGGIGPMWSIPRNTRRMLRGRERRIPEGTPPAEVEDR
jgi:hypothetical protein